MASTPVVASSMTSTSESSTQRQQPTTVSQQASSSPREPTQQSHEEESSCGASSQERSVGLPNSTAVANEEVVEALMAAQKQAEENREQLVNANLRLNQQIRHIEILQEQLRKYGIIDKHGREEKEREEKVITPSIPHDGAPQERPHRSSAQQQSQPPYLLNSTSKRCLS